MDSTASPPPSKIARFRPRQPLCEYSAYQCDRPCYMRTRFCDAHICEMQTLRSVGAANSREGSSEGGPGGTSGLKGVNAGQPTAPTPPVTQCQYRVRRYERRCKNPVPSDSGDVHFCSEHRARVATRRDGSAVLASGSNGPVATGNLGSEATLKEVLNGASGAAPTTVSPAALTEAVVSDYVHLPQRWLSSSNRSGSLDAHSGPSPSAAPGLPMPRAKDERGEWKEDWDSDAESPATDDDDKVESFRNAGVYTVNEMLIHAMFHRRKLMLLYQEHMAALRRILQHEYAVYEEVRSNHKQMRTATNTIIMRGRQAEIFRALRKFKRYSGVESLVHDKSKRIRLRSVCPDKLKPSANPQRCAYNDPTKDEKCPERVLPLSKYCPKHILHQANQCLFERCYVDRCEQPVLGMAREEKEDSSGETRVDPEKLCPAHRPPEAITDWLFPDLSRSGLMSHLSGRASPPHPPPEAVAAAKLAAAVPFISPDKSDAGVSGDRLLLKREDSMSLHEPFEFNLFLMNEEEMLDPKLMEEALSVLRQSEGLDPSPNSSMAVGNTSGSGPNVGPVVSGVGPGVSCPVSVAAAAAAASGDAWSQQMVELVDVVLRDSPAVSVEGAGGEGSVSVGPSVVGPSGVLHMGELWPGDLDPLREMWEGLVAADAAIEQRKAADAGLEGADSSGGFMPSSVPTSHTGPCATEEEEEVEQVTLESGPCAVIAELQAIDCAGQAGEECDPLAGPGMGVEGPPISLPPTFAADELSREPSEPPIVESVIRNVTTRAVKVTIREPQPDTVQERVSDPVQVTTQIPVQIPTQDPDMVSSQVLVQISTQVPSPNPIEDPVAVPSPAPAPVQDSMQESVPDPEPAPNPVEDFVPTPAPV